MRASATQLLLASFLQADGEDAPPTPASSDDNPLPPLPGGESGLPLPPAAPDGELPLPGGMPPLPGGSDESTDDAPLPIPVDGQPSTSSAGTADENSQEVNLPIFGTLNASQTGMPLFTIAIGLIDGFNPCAMWVLLFLLSLLVNLKSRWKMFLIAGTFVFISGLAYFAFMAAWLNVFMLLGYLRGVQITLGLFGVVVGGFHIKDFFAFKKGLSFSIPESAKPGIYERTRKILNAESMWAAMVGVVVLAVLVNVIELLCTAGLPALYTNVLTMQNYPAWKNYAYLGLYNVAYMFDDSIMVIVAVATLGRRKLQEKEGRWLKLFSGALIFALGLVLLFRPEWLAKLT